jgi:DNA-directed RNA polymerase subunit RPC12/RpoP
MARTREMIRDLYQLILEDVAEASRRHVCEESKKYGSCVVCCSSQARFVFIHTAVLRQLGLLDPELLEAEQMLLDILGEKRYNNILREQTRAFMSGPSKRCIECKAKVKILDSYKSAWTRMARDGQQNLYCPNCGSRVPFMHTEFLEPRAMRTPQKVPEKGLNRIPTQRPPTLGEMNREDRARAVFRAPIQNVRWVTDTTGGTDGTNTT